MTISETVLHRATVGVLTGVAFGYNTDDDDLPQPGDDKYLWASCVAQDALDAARPSRQELIRVLFEQGLGPDGEQPHSWRCSDKGRYPGDCECPGEFADAILELLGASCG